LYAYYTQERAQYQLAFDGLATIFQPDLSLMVSKEDQMPRLEGLRQLAEIQLKEYFQEITSEETIPVEAQEAAYSVHKNYLANVKHISKNLKHNMVVEVESINKQYLKILYYLQQLPLIALWDENRRLLENSTKTSLLAKNKVLYILSKWGDLQRAFDKNRIGWTEDEENLIKKLFIENILTDETFLTYLPNAGKKFEDDLVFVQYVLKNFFLKHPSMTEFFEEKDLNWSLNKDVVKSLSNKTFKITALEDLSIQPLAIQWEDDQLFFEELFEYCISEDKQLSTYIGDQTKNWESDRLTVADFIILKMALAEMIQFSSIPIKVSINEYIELAKNYSTPKSGQFINGILDVVSNRLVQEKVINKSGRGLIDIANK
jgi:N utilization substance protein B